MSHRGSLRPFPLSMKMVSYILVSYLNRYILVLMIIVDLKLDNVLVNYGGRDNRFTDVQLSDFGGVCHVDHKYAKGATPIGPPIWRSPEVMPQLPSGWNTSIDILSFRLCVRSFHIYHSITSLAPSASRNTRPTTNLESSYSS